jgi:hypothetical protein
MFELDAAHASWRDLGQSASTFEIRAVAAAGDGFVYGDSKGLVAYWDAVTGYCPVQRVGQEGAFDYAAAINASEVLFGGDRPNVQAPMPVYWVTLTP